MIIEIRDIPSGCKIKTIDCKIHFDDSGLATVSTVVQPQVNKTPEPVTQLQVSRDLDRPENVAPEMQDLEF